MLTDEGNFEKLSFRDLEKEVEKGNEDLIFSVGERVKIKGGDFIIKSFGKKMIVLEGLPGTRMKKNAKTD